MNKEPESIENQAPVSLKNKINICGNNTEGDIPNNFLFLAYGEKVDMNYIDLEITGRNGDRGLMNINSVTFNANYCAIDANRNGGKNNLENRFGTPNMCIGHDGEDCSEAVNFHYCTINLNESLFHHGNGIEAFQGQTETDFTFTYGTLNANNNGGNGIASRLSEQMDGKSKVWRFINTDVSLCGNGKGKQGSSMGFAAPELHLENTDGSYHYINVSDNYSMGISANGLGDNNTSITAKGYTIIANNNGTEVENDYNKVYGYGIYLGRKTSSFEDCVLETKLNGKEGLTFKTDADFINTRINSNCNGRNYDEENQRLDTKIAADKSINFKDCPYVCLGNTLTKGKTDVNNSMIFANLIGEGSSTAISPLATEKIYLTNEDGTQKPIETSKNKICHHDFNWGNIEKQKDVEEKSYGVGKIICKNTPYSKVVPTKDEDINIQIEPCADAKIYVPTTRLRYEQNTADAVTNMPEILDNQMYLANVAVSDQIPQRNGYKFLFWTVAPAADSAKATTVMLKEPTTVVYAQWEKEGTPYYPPYDPPTEPPEIPPEEIPDEEPPLIDIPDEPIPIDDDPVDEPNSEVPKTGDSNKSIFALVFVLFISAAGVSFLQIRRKEN